jgi:hypothetical protein
MSSTQQPQVGVCDECKQVGEDVRDHDRFPVRLCDPCREQVDSGEQRLIVEPYARPESRNCASANWSQYRWPEEWIATGLVPKTHRTTLLILARAFDRREGYAYRSQAEMAETWGVGERTLRRHLNDLEALGVIWRKPRRRTKGAKAGTRGRDAIYLCVPPIPTGHDDRLVEEQPAMVAGSTGHGGRAGSSSTSSDEVLATARTPSACGPTSETAQPGEAQDEATSRPVDGELHDCTCCGREQMTFWVAGAWWCEPCFDFALETERAAVPLEPVGVVAEPSDEAHEAADAPAAEAQGRVDVADVAAGAASGGRADGLLGRHGSEATAEPGRDDAEAMAAAGALTTSDEIEF